MPRHSISYRSFLKRVADSSLDELLTRGQQGIRKRWDTFAYLIGVTPRTPKLLDLPALRVPRFFFDESDIPLLISEVQNRFPDEWNDKISQAEGICRGEYSVLGYKALSCTPKINWHSDIVSGKVSPQRGWPRIHYLDFEEVGDSKIIWEFNRHQHLVILAVAYRFTEHKKFAQEIFNQWYDWQRSNPYPIGINWASSLEVALRSMSWLWVWHLLSGTDAAPRGFREDLCKGLAIHGRHIEKYLSTYFSPNTHLLGEAVALFFIGTLCPEIRAASKWKEQGWGIICREAQRQVRRDGVHFEQSTYYHVYALDFFLHARILAAKNEVLIPQDFDRVLQRMLDFLCCISQAGIVPRFGDDDGGRVFNPRRNRAEHLLDPLATGSILFQRSDWKTPATHLSAETLWLLGRHSAQEYDGVDVHLHSARSVYFPESGFYVMAAGVGHSQQLVIDAGPQGEGNSGHGHADALSMHLSIAGQEWLSDPGTFSYLEGEHTREAFRSTAAHNTLQVDGESQAVPTGPFSWSELPDTHADIWEVGRMCVFFEGHHTGYTRLPDPVIHRRSVFYLNSFFWLVRDVAEGRGEHQLDLSWHAAPGVHLEERAGRAFMLQRNGSSLALLSTSTKNWSAEVISGGFSAGYGHQEPVPVLRFSIRTELPCGLTTLILPLNGKQERLGRLLDLTPATGTPGVYSCAYCEIENTYQWFFSDNNIRWHLEGLASDARFVYCLFDKAKRLRQFVICGGSFLEIGGRSVFESPKLVPIYEWQEEASENQ
jgi:hypothetical protein